MKLSMRKKKAFTKHQQYLYDIERFGDRFSDMKVRERLRYFESLSEKGQKIIKSKIKELGFEYIPLPLKNNYRSFDRQLEMYFEWQIKKHQEFYA